MIEIHIPSWSTIRAEHLVLDYNGTLAIDGVLIPGVKARLNELAKTITIHVITADTFGLARVGLEGIACKLVTAQNENQSQQKLDYIMALDPNRVVAVGNGFNDSLMLEHAALGIALVQGEGASARALQSADLVCPSIADALDLLLKPLRIDATLRN